jgi:hypothetical protein
MRENKEPRKKKPEKEKNQTGGGPGQGKIPSTE